MDTLVIEVETTGRVASLHTDKFDLGFLGDKKIRRQTEIVFREGPQTWSICLITKEGALHSSDTFDGFSGYEDAREFEVRWINNCRLYQLDPESCLGLGYANFLRFGPQGEDKCFTLPDGSCIADDCMHSAPSPTGRVAPTEPNIQNIPLHTEEAQRIRDALQYGLDLHTPGRTDGPTHHHVAMFRRDAIKALGLPEA